MGELCETKTTGKKKSPRGIATNDLVFSACQGNNSYVFSRILDLYIPPGAAIADITYGNGVFWKDIDIKKYHCVFSDIQSNVDCRALPYKSDSYDCVVFDPPYMHVSGGNTHANHQNYERYYQNNKIPENTKKYHEAVLDLYFRTAGEVFRVLKRKGIFIVKCQDEVCANRQRLTHVELINESTVHNYICGDLFVVMRNNKPGMSRVIKQRHTYTGNKAYRLFESEDFNAAFSSYVSYLDKFTGRKTPYNCVQLVDRNSRRIIEGNVFVPKKPAIKPEKKHEEQGYER